MIFTKTLKSCKRLKLRICYTALITVAVYLTWTYTAGRSNTDIEKTILRSIISQALSNNSQKINGQSFVAIGDSQGTSRHELAQPPPHPDAPSYKKLLKMVADDDFNLTCKHTVRLPLAQPPSDPDVRRYKKLLKMVADDDFNLTCKHTVRLPERPSFIKESKNPCFFNKNTNSLQCLPHFYVPGFPKCATTDFHDVIKNHQEFVPTVKEQHWFNYLQYTEKYGNFEDYLEKFQPLAQRITCDLQKNEYSRLITGDFTPDYLCDTIRWACWEENAGLQTPKVTNAHAIHRLTPNAKFIVMMREPVARLHSRFKHMILVAKSFRKYWGKPTPQTFHKAAMRAIDLYGDCIRRSSTRECLYNGTIFNAAMMNDVGLYSACLKDYLDLFPRENFLFIVFEEYRQNRSRTFEKVYKFLDMDPPSKSSVALMNAQLVQNRAIFKDTMLEETKMALRSFFTPMVQELKDMIGEDVFKIWGY